MRLLISLMLCLSVNVLFAQQTTTAPEDQRLFAQCMFSISDQQEVETLNNEMYNVPYIEMVRLDWHTQRALVIVTNLQELTEDEFKSWFGEHESGVSCVQIGVYGVDTMNPYPFTNCQ